MEPAESARRSARANYYRVFATFLRNALVREMTFRGNLLITIVTRTFYFVAQLTLFEIIYRQVVAIDDWSREEYFAFMATGMLINSLVEAFFMPNCANFSELIRTGNLDFVLLKPIDPQFLVSFEKMELAMLNQARAGLVARGVCPGQNRAGRSTRCTRPCTCCSSAVGVTLFYSLMLLWRRRASGSAAIRGSTISGFTSRFSPAIRGESTAVLWRARRCSSAFLRRFPFCSS